MSSRPQLYRTWPYIKSNVRILMLSLLLAIPAASIKGSPAILAKFAVDDVLINQNKSMVYMIPIALMIIAIINVPIRFFHYYLVRVAGARVAQSLRNDLEKHMMRLSLGYFSQTKGGILLSKMINDVQLLITGVSSINHAIREPILFTGLLIYALYLNWRLTLGFFLAAPLLALLFGNSGKHTRRYATKIQETLGELSAHLAERISGMSVIKAFNLEGALLGRFMKKNRELTRTIFKAARVEELAHPISEAIVWSAASIMFFFGLMEVYAGKTTGGELIGFLTCIGLMIDPIRKMNELNIRLQQCSAAAARVFTIFDEVPEIRQVPNALALPSFEKNIEFKNVRFHYGTEQPILRDFSLDIRKGEMIALVGPSGAGKSTILNLIPRFYDCVEGSIAVDGYDVRSLTIKSLRSKIALVTQEVFLFHDSIRANITAGNYHYSEDDLYTAAEAAQVLPIIEKLPGGFDTMIGDRGQKLSGGERQRISIARAILKDAPILLLDEATSNLDAENERLVQRALDELLKGRTSIVVAHRLSTIRQADRIVYIDRGRILETGSHEELVRRNGWYAKAVELQAQGS